MQQKSTRGIQFEDVAQAADVLLQQGTRPTIERIRLQIGRGSPNTVSPMLEQWFSGLGKRLGMGNTPGQGADMPEEVLQAAKKLWEVAAAEAHANSEQFCVNERNRLDGESQSLEEANRQLDARENAVNERLAAMEDTLQLCKRQLQESNARGVVIQRTVAEQSAEIALNQEALSHARDEATALQHRLDSVKNLAKEEKAVLEESYRASEHRWLAEVDRARQEMRKSALLAQQKESKMDSLQQQTESLKDKIHAHELEKAQQVSALQVDLANALQIAEKARILLEQFQQQQRSSTSKLEHHEVPLKPLRPFKGNSQMQPIRRTLGKSRN